MVSFSAKSLTAARSSLVESLITRLAVPRLLRVSDLGCRFASKGSSAVQQHFPRLPRLSDEGLASVLQTYSRRLARALCACDHDSLVAWATLADRLLRTRGSSSLCVLCASLNDVRSLSTVRSSPLMPAGTRCFYLTWRRARPGALLGEVCTLYSAPLAPPPTWCTARPAALLMIWPCTTPFHLPSACFT